MGLAPGKGIEMERYGLIRFLKNYRKGYNIGFFRRMKKVCSCGVLLLLFSSNKKATHHYYYYYYYFIKVNSNHITTANPLLILNILIYFLVSNFSLLNPLLILKN